MKERFIIGLMRYLIIYLFISCTTKTEIKKEYYETGELHLKYEVDNTGNKHGKYEEYYRHGKLKSQALYSGDVQNGKVSVFYENGTLWRTLTVLNGVPQDTFKSYYPNGGLKEFSLFRDGQKNGIYKEYFDNGNLKTEGHLVNSLPDGTVKYYNRHQQVDSISRFKTGRLLSRIIRKEDLTTYYSLEHKYSCEVPRDWGLVENYQNIALIFLSSPTAESINLTMDELNNQSFPDHLNGKINDLKYELTNYNLESKEENSDRIKITYTYEVDNQSFQSTSIFFNKTTTYYTLTFTALKEDFSKVLPIFNAFNESFNFHESNV